eukprot:TRINITY_DN14083_c0_g1_i1.p1 TRINITY_DN14083_c0_g1~~TRINITY_DN14083_c0_g1_i1.p1  ORF type:complete len:203 (+),score=32.42 TRINITY_DN14083_c0_g1_i1:166-774(+)
MLPTSQQAGRKRKRPSTEPSAEQIQSVRRNATRLLLKAIASSESAFGFEGCDFEAAADKVEQAAFQTLDWASYKSKCKTLATQLKSADLVLSLLLGEVEGDEVVTATSEDMCNEVARERKEKLRQQSLNSAMLADDKFQMMDTDIFVCGECKGSNTKYKVVGDTLSSRKAEVWGNCEQDRLPPQAKVYCKDCGHTWERDAPY